MLGSIFGKGGRFLKRSKKSHGSGPVLLGQAFKYRHGHRAGVAFTMHLCMGWGRIHPADRKRKLFFNHSRRNVAHDVGRVSAATYISRVDLRESWVCSIPPDGLVEVAPVLVVDFQNPKPLLSCF